MIHINKSQFQQYMDCNKNTASVYYDLYLELANKDKRLKLTIYDVSQIDDVPVEEIKKKLKLV